MNPQFASVVDPIFLATLQLESRIQDKAKFVTTDERAILVRKLDEAETLLGNARDWQLAKYALCAWIDDKLIETPWTGSSWWKDNCLEVKYFGRRDAHEDFFKRAADANSLPHKDALEVFYIAVVLGFKGFYRNPDASYKTSIAQELQLPDTIEGWCRNVARSLQLRQNRPAIIDRIQVGGNARPLTGKTSVVMFTLISVVLVAVAIACFILLFDIKSGEVNP